MAKKERLHPLDEQERRNAQRRLLKKLMREELKRRAKKK